jgi:hypothetical protein
MSAFASDDRWYVGEGATQGMYVVYRIQEHDTKNGDPYELTIHFKELDEDGNWIAPAYVKYKGQVYEGTVKFGDNLAVLGGGSIIPDEMKPFIPGGYSGSLQWLEAFTAKSAPLSLSAANWGKIASIGGEQIKPLGKERVTVPAGTYDATIIGWHKSVDNKIWVVNDFPYPVKAETFVEVASGRPPIQFAFTLLETGTGEPPIPEEETEIPTPPLQETTGRGTYEVDLSWDPETIDPNSTVEFEVSFFDNNGNALGRVSYDFTVTDANGNAIYDRANSFTGDDEIGTETVEFGDMGPVTITVTINSVSGVNTGTFTETVDFDLVVVPEFPASVAIIAAAVIGLVVVMTRLRGTSLGLFGGRNPF